MSNLIVLEEKDISAKGVNQNNIINEEKLKNHFFSEDYDNLKLIERIPKLNLNENKPVLIYPGCGADVFFPLIYMQEIFPDKREFKFIFIDLENYLGLIKTILDDVGVSFEESKKENKINFYWEKIKIELEFVNEDISKVIEKLPNYDLYFERAFRIMKERILDYEKRILQKLNSKGIIISDSGFEEVKLNRIEVSSKLSSYGEMVIGIKD